MKAREAAIALALIALLAAPAACGRYGEPSRTGPATAARGAPGAAPAQAPVLAPADGSSEECPPDAQDTQDPERQAATP